MGFLVSCTGSSPIASSLIIFAVPAGGQLLISVRFAHFHRSDTDTSALASTRYKIRLQLMLLFYFRRMFMGIWSRIHSLFANRLQPQKTWQPGSQAVKQPSSQECPCHFFYPATELCSCLCGYLGVVTTGATLAAASRVIFVYKALPGKKKTHKTHDGVPSVASGWNTIASRKSRRESRGPGARNNRTELALSVD